MLRVTARLPRTCLQMVDSERNVPVPPALRLAFGHAGPGTAADSGAAALPLSGTQLSASAASEAREAHSVARPRPALDPAAAASPTPWEPEPAGNLKADLDARAKGREDNSTTCQCFMRADSDP